jgi:hypothetical protein
MHTPRPEPAPLTEESNDPSVIFLTVCIGQLEAHLAQVEKAVTTLRALLTSAGQMDFDNVRTMAAAVMDRVAGQQAQVTLKGRLTHSARRSPPPDEFLPFDPNREPVHPTPQQSEVFRRIVQGYQKHGNRFFSIQTIQALSTADYDTIGSVICLSHPHRFEQKVLNNTTQAWRLKPDFFAELERPASSPAPEAAPATGAGHGAVRQLPQMTQTDAAAYVLRAAGEPLTTNQIVETIARIGLYHVEGDLKQFTNAIFTSMTRKAEKGDTFVKVKRGTWGLVEWGTANKEDK